MLFAARKKDRKIRSDLYLLGLDYNDRYQKWFCNIYSQFLYIVKVNFFSSFFYDGKILPP